MTHPNPYVSLLLAVCLSISVSSHAWTEEISPTVSKALEAYQKGMEKAKDTFAKDAAKCAESLAKVLQKEIESLEKKGDEAGAALLKAKVEELEDDPLAADIITEAFKPKPDYSKAWCVGSDWEVVWPGYRTHITLTKDGAASRSDTLKGSYVMASDNSVTITWADGEVWILGAPPKHTPDATNGRKEKGGVFTVTRQR